LPEEGRFPVRRRIISFHSSRGGTGKTVIASNLAVIMASKGVNVSLLDLDFRAPSLYQVFQEFHSDDTDFWINDYLNSMDRSIDPQEFLINLKIPNLEGKLVIGFANPSIGAIQDILMKSRSWEAKALQKLFMLRRFLFEDDGVNICIYDTSPGIQYSSLNAMMSSDQIVFVSSADPLEIEQVTNMLKEYNDILNDKSGIILNKVFPETDYWSNDKQDGYISQLSEDIRHSVIGMIPCYCDILKTENRLLILKKPNHPFLKKLEEIFQELLYERISSKVPL